MKNTTLFLLPLMLATLSTNSPAAGMGADDPLLFYLKADKLEVRDTDEGSLQVWELDAWLGYDLDKLWIKSSGERHKGEVESNEIDILYSRAISPFWDLQMGLRHEFRPKPAEDSIGIGVMGVAPYLFEIDANVFVNEDGDLNARLDAEYEYLFTQRLVLVPNLELDFNSADDNIRGVVSGLSTMELGLRLHYEIKREFSPYIGINYEKKFGNSVVPKSSETQLLAGLSFWF
jgi:copper resistance protein B